MKYEIFELRLTNNFRKQYEKLITKDKRLTKKFSKALALLSSNPFHNSLRSHKVDTIEYSDVWSSWVTGDIRIIWIYDNKDKNKIIILLQTGNHDIY